MCGIAGIVDLDRDAQSPFAVRGMTESLRHRGPDDYGYYAWNGREGNVGRDVELVANPCLMMGHRRLSIIDLSDAAAQPMRSPDGRYVLAFNGEIYNYIELRDTLAAAGVAFHTRSDTEVLLHALAHWGEEALGRLRGMFALAFFDQEEGRLLLARDPYGMKPLYYAQSERQFAFASEMHALLSLPWVGRGIHPQRCFDYLRFGLTDHGDETMVRDVRQVPQGASLLLDCGTGSLAGPVTYFQLPPPASSGTIPYADAVEETRRLFQESVRIHLRSDVPVGISLSGGLDSSAIVGAIRSVEPEFPLQAISYISREEDSSEYQYAALVAEQWGARLHVVEGRENDFSAALDDLLASQAEPFGSWRVFAQYLVFEKARELGLKVMLDGQGADEFLAGYPPYQGARLTGLLRRYEWHAALNYAGNCRRLNGTPLRSLLGNSVMRLYIPDCVQRILRKLLRLELAAPWLNREWLAGYKVSMQSQWHGDETDTLQQQLRESQQRGLPQLLRYEDRNSMHFSIESRLPFLDPQVTSFLASLPDSYLIGDDGLTKRVFRDAAAIFLPEELRHRRDKIGFAMSERAWFSYNKEWMNRVIMGVDAARFSLFDVGVLRREWQRQYRLDAPSSFMPWRWVNLILWAEAGNVTF